ncbi:MAG: AAA family ATPase [Kiritimatiellae bacterium]|nr:AAA family ATPase [Kiritimatiellia bacterium]
MRNPLDTILHALDAGTRCFIIRGAAGTGKTTLIRSLVPVLQERGLFPMLMAPTGRAAMVLHKRTGFDTSTIHSGIFNIVNEPIRDEQDDALKWIFPLKDDKDVENTAFIIDEASMVGLSKHDNDRELFQFGSGSLLGDLIQYSGIKTQNTSNILFFVGDSFQLPPVMEQCETPPALDAEKIEELTSFKPTVIELTEVFRQSKGSGILAEATRLRSALEAKDFNRFSFTSHEDVSMVSEETLSVVPDWKDSIDEKIAIAHTNAKVQEYNAVIRGFLGHFGKLPEYGERLLSIRNTRILLPSGEKVQFFNGDFLTVVNTFGETFSLQGYYRPKESEKTFTFTYTFKRMSLRWTYEPERGQVDNIWINVTPIILSEWDEHDCFAQMGLYNGVKHFAEEILRKKYPDFRKDRSKKLFWDKLVKEKMAELPWLRAPIVKFGYAVTGHKSQGGEWNYVWADYNCGLNLMSSYFFRWAYTVTTRAKEHLFVANSPHIDALSNVFASNKSYDKAVEVDTCVQRTSSAIDEVIRSIGLTLGQIEELSSRYRIHVQGKDKTGYVDVIYRKNAMITHIENHVDGLDDAARRRLSSLVGKKTGEVFGEEAEQSDVAEPEISVRPQHETIVARILQSLKGKPLQLVSAKAFSDYHIRLSFQSPIGGGELDLYFDAKGRVTNSGVNTLNEKDWNALKQSILL